MRDAMDDHLSSSYLLSFAHSINTIFQPYFAALTKYYFYWIDLFQIT